jgi:hypothetical protein
MFGRVMIIVAALVVLGGCVQRPRPIMVPGGRTVGNSGASKTYNSASDIVAGGGRCASGTGGKSCTDKNGGHWFCQPGSPCVKVTEDNE